MEKKQCSTLEEIKKLPTLECTCNMCKSFCVYRPCWGTVEDIEKLMDAGYADRLMLEWWGCEDPEVKILLLCPALKGHEGKSAPFDPVGDCTFYIDGMCEIHGLKPLEGRTSHHNVAAITNMHEILSRESWETEEGKACIERWRKLTGCSTDPCEEISTLDVLQFAIDLLKNVTKQ